MKILILSFYYYPDLSAGSFRTTALVAALRRCVPSGTIIDVVTSMPNRYESFTRQASQIESCDGLSISRIRLPAHRSDIRGQSRAFIHYARHALNYVSGRQYDIVFATSSRLMTATLGAAIAGRKSAKLYLDIRDIFADTIKDVLPAWIAWPASKIFSMLEWWTIRRADRVNLVSRGFESYFRRRYRNLSLAWFTNGIDDEFINEEPASAPTESSGRFTILYAGNIGEGQCLHEILPGMARALGSRARFLVIGDGGRRSVLEAAVRAAELDNVEIRKPMDRGELLAAYRSADILFVHLGKHEAFEKVLPSKLFEYAALRKPILAGMSGYPAEFVRQEIVNAAVFPPCNVPAALAALQELVPGDTPRKMFIEKYSRKNISTAMAEDVLAISRKIV